MSAYPTPHDDRQIISNPVRIGLRLLGALMFLAGVALSALLVVPGPAQVAASMGETCVHGDPKLNDAEQCTILDVLELASVAPLLVIVGTVLVLALRRSSIRSDAPVAQTWTPIGHAQIAAPADRQRVDEFLRNRRTDGVV